jgi:hypothetical protein
MQNSCPTRLRQNYRPPRRTPPWLAALLRWL